LEAHGHISRARSLSDRRSQVVSITDAGNAALVEAHELERAVLSSANVDTDKLRRELLTLVRDLVARDASPVADAIVAAADQSL
jgi:MarR family transcriptional regulator, organic hydroperoxide resistance regulator